MALDDVHTDTALYRIIAAQCVTFHVWVISMMLMNKGLKLSNMHVLIFFEIPIDTFGNDNDKIEDNTCCLSTQSL